jgi:hypothetical protein
VPREWGLALAQGERRAPEVFLLQVCSTGTDPPFLSAVQVTVAADYPALRVADVYSDGVGKRTLWRQMGVSHPASSQRHPASS